ncbi:MAG: flagellar filament capping protein FliD [Gammaproteobacteria bacterium]|nr:flagellar filament capping protein FliD [Gammaproteobacteria bacterium]
MVGISSLGIGSGLDLSSLVEQLVAAERAPTENRLNFKEANLQAELSAFGTLKSTLASIQGSLETLTDVSAGRTATSTDEAVVSVSADTTATEGHYDVQVSQLAATHSLASQAYSDPSDAVGTGTLTISFGTTDYDTGTDTYNGFTANSEKTALELTIDTNNNTLEGIRDAINAAESDVNAVVVNDGSGHRLLLNSNDSGAVNSLQVTVTNDSGSGLANLAFDGTATNLQQTAAAMDAQFTVNGLAISADSNSIGDAIPGVTLTLNGTNDPDTVSLDVVQDNSPVRNALDGFIRDYNALADQLKLFTGYDADTQSGGVLVGDSMTRGLERQLRDGLIDALGEASDPFRYLVDIGVTTDDRGRLSLDSEAFEAAIDQNFEGVVGLLQGFGGILDETVSGFLGTGGAIEGRTQGIQSRIDDIGDQRQVLNRRVAALEARFVKQFSALDILLGQLQNTSNFLAQQLENLPTPGQSSSN